MKLPALWAGSFTYDGFMMRFAMRNLDCYGTVALKKEDCFSIISVISEALP
jgi:hypothetical protein